MLADEIQTQSRARAASLFSPMDIYQNISSHDGAGDGDDDDDDSGRAGGRSQHQEKKKTYIYTALLTFSTCTQYK